MDCLPRVLGPTILTLSVVLLAQGFAQATVGAGSCVGTNACLFNSGISARTRATATLPAWRMPGPWASALHRIPGLPAQRGMSDDACNGEFACAVNTAVVGQESCNGGCLRVQHGAGRPRVL